MRKGKFYRKNEAEIMTSLGLKPTKNSGSGWIEKEDGMNDFMIAQLKSTDAESIKFNLRDFHVLEYNATTAHKVPLFVLQFIKTSELFILARPIDIPSIAEYIDCGKCNIIEQVVTDVAIKKPKKGIVKSGDRQQFWDDKEKERLKWQKKSK